MSEATLTSPQDAASSVAVRKTQKQPYPSEEHLNVRGYVPALDGVRGLAIATVLFHHVWPYEWSNPVTKALTWMSHIGWLGVDLFFVLSGFLITGILIESREKSGYFKNFIVRRSLRIFPLYFLFLFICFAILPSVLSAMGLTDEKLLQNRQALPWFLTYMSNHLTFFNDEAVRGGLGWAPLQGLQDGLHDFLAITWSLSVEEQFYIFWPAVVFFFHRSLPTAVLIMGATALGCRLVSVLFVDDWQHVTNMATLCRMDSLALGAGVAHYVRSNRFNIQLVRRITKICFFVVSPGILAYLFLQGGRADAGWAIAGYTLSVIALLGVLVAAIDRKSRFVRPFFESKPLVTLGKYSYGLYLYHMLILYLIHLWRPAELAPNGSPLHPDHFQPFFGSSVYDAPLRFALVMALTAVIAWISFHGFEKRFLGLKKYFEPK